MRSFITKTLEVMGGVGILYAYWILCMYCPWILAITFFVIALFIWDYLRNKENDINTNYDDQL